jgi:hypothetical protein
VLLWQEQALLLGRALLLCMHNQEETRAVEHTLILQWPLQSASGWTGSL